MPTHAPGQDAQGGGAKPLTDRQGAEPQLPFGVRGGQGIPLPRVLKELNDGPWKTRIAEPKCKGPNWWRGDHKAQLAVYNNRIRLGTGKGREAAKRRAELAERSFSARPGQGRHAQEWPRDRENVQKRYRCILRGSTSTC